MKEKFQYVLDTFNQVYNLDLTQNEISYGLEPTAKIHIKQGRTTALERKQAYFPDKNQIIWKIWNHREIPFFFDSENTEIYTEVDGTHIINYDIIASSFFLLSGWQEYFSTEKDSYGRFRCEDSYQYKLGIMSIPVVNYYFDILKTIWEINTKKTVPLKNWNGSKFAACLTHDIDTCESGWIQGSFHAIKKHHFITPIILASKKLFNQDVWFNFNEILNIEKQFGAKSTFFFLAQNKPNLRIKNADYSIEKSKFETVFNKITSHGSEIGLHGSTGTHTNLEMLIRDKNKIKLSINGNRFHFLLFDIKKTPQVIDNAGFRYDSSLGFAESFGFRNSFCFPFRPFDIQKDKSFGYYEIPLVLMDGTLQKYLHLSPSDSIEKIIPVFEEVIKFKGVITILWHNSHFSNYKYPGWKDTYIGILSKCKERFGLLDSCSNILDIYLNG